MWYYNIQRDRGTKTISSVVSVENIYMHVKPFSAGCGVYSTWKHVLAKTRSPKSKPQVGEIEKW